MATREKGAALLADRHPLVGSIPEGDLGVTDELLRPVFGRARGGWRLLVLLTAAGTGVLGLGILATVLFGVGTWGNNIPVGWAFGITNFVWWIGIGHAGTFISAILLLFEQKWRTSINRIAEAMTLFAVANAALFPLLHLGRPWFAYWLVPYPSTMAVWPNFKSALVYDVVAISTYGWTSLLFWYLGLVPDLAAARDRAATRGRRLAYGVFALGWRGSASDWERWRKAYYLLAGLATPLVVSVHSVVSLDFAMTQEPGWHGTIFPPYFVAGAIFSGFAMVLTLLIPARRVLRLQGVVTRRHLANMGKILLVTALIVSYSYVLEYFGAWYRGDIYEKDLFYRIRTTGQFAPHFWTMIACNVVIPQLLWFPRVRSSPVWLWVISIFVNIGMWLERFVIIVVSLSADFLPSSWASYSPTWVDYSLLFGTIAFFLLLFLLFIRFVPAVPIQEVKEMLAEEKRHGAARALHSAGAEPRPPDGRGGAA